MSVLGCSSCGELYGLNGGTGFTRILTRCHWMPLPPGPRRALKTFLRTYGDLSVRMLKCHLTNQSAHLHFNGMQICVYVCASHWLTVWEGNRTHMSAVLMGVSDRFVSCYIDHCGSGWTLVGSKSNHRSRLWSHSLVISIYRCQLLDLYWVSHMCVCIKQCMSAIHSTKYYWIFSSICQDVSVPIVNHW